MEKYKVILYPRAYRDIDEIYSYIALEKLAPENAKGQTDRIWDALKSLEAFPSSHEVILNDWVSAIIVPEIHRQEIDPAVPKELRARVHFLRNDCKDIWEWSEKVYEYVKKCDAKS